MESEDKHSLTSELRKRSFALRKSSADIRNMIEKHTQDIQEASARLIWHEKTHSVILIISPKGYHIIDALLQIFNEKLPNLKVKVRPHLHYKEQAFYVTASEEYLLKEAEQLGYHPNDGSHKLTSLQRQSLILHLINSLRYNCHQINHIMEKEFRHLKFKEDDAIIAKLVSLSLIKQVLPLHNESELSELRTEWVSAFFSFQPLDKICQYFGPKIAIYFAFLGFYTYGLIFPAILGIFITLYRTDNCVYSELFGLSFTVLNILWSTVFLQKWRNTNKKLVEKWRSFHVGTDERLIRSMFAKHYIINSEFERKLFKYFVSFPIIVISLVLAFGVMFAIFRFQTYWDDIIINEKGYPIWSSHIPKIILAIMISIFDSIYYKLAIWLNKQENYRLESNYENNLTQKLILFQFMNSFLPLFYIAFYIGDMDKLRDQLVALLITRQVIGNIKETIIPFLMESYQLSKIHSIKVNEISSEEIEANMLKYESTFDDYLELIIQFGYVMIFSSTFPLAAVCALINNIIEIRSDAFKISVVYQRPFAGDLIRDIGLWEDIMNAIVYIAIIVNCALIAKTKQISKIVGIEDDVQLVIISVIIEV